MPLEACETELPPTHTLTPPHRPTLTPTHTLTHTDLPRYSAVLALLLQILYTTAPMQDPFPSALLRVTPVALAK